MRIRPPFAGILVAFLIALPLLLPPTVRAQSTTTFDEYRAAVANALALATQAMSLAPAEQAAHLEDAAALLESIETVQTPSGALVAVNNRELIALLRDPSQMEAAAARLAALQAALQEPLASINLDDLAVLERILNRAPFVRTEAWYEQWLRELGEFLDRLLGNTAAGIFDARDLLIVFAAVAVVGILIYFVLNLRRSLVAEEELAVLLPEYEVRTPGVAFDNAQRYINAGDYRAAVRQLYLATLLLLDQRGRIKYDPTLTNREYLKHASNDPRTAAALQPIIETFDRIWYGFEPISPDDFAAYQRRVEQVRDL